MPFSLYEEILLVATDDKGQFLLYGLSSPRSSGKSTYQKSPYFIIDSNENTIDER